MMNDPLEIKMPEFSSSLNTGNDGGIFGTGASWFDSYGADGNQTSQGILSPSASALGSLSNIYLGLKTLSLGEDQLDFQKESFDKNYGAQLKDYYNRLETRGRAQALTASNEQLGLDSNASQAERDQAISAAALDYANARKIS